MSKTVSNVNNLTDAQKRGANPDDNAWMSASAGTGKTQVLTARIKRLLLRGVPPHAILAITFTKAGAAEMARRVRGDLARWVRLPDLDLKVELMAIGDERFDDPQQWSFARTLFAKVIDAPGGGLSIQTIHSFCQSLLAGFPEEAGLAPGFRALDEGETRELRSEVLADLIADAQSHRDVALLERIDALALAVDEKSLRGFLDRCAGAADALDALPAGIGPWLRGQWGLPSELSAEQWLASRCNDDAIDLSALRTIYSACRTWGTATGGKYATAISDWVARDMAGRIETAEALWLVFAKQDGELRKDWEGKGLSSVLDLAVRLHGYLSEAIAVAAQLRRTDELALALEVGRVFARAVMDRKRREGLVDFDDLIRRTADLLGTPGRAEWIRYKLDQRIDHILVDEAQDTNQRQWAIVDALAGEYFAGAGAKDGVTRTLFVVGDYKQAIYGFQGTSPENFASARREFFAQGVAAARAFDDVEINENFRSSPPVLTVVDRVIASLGPDALGLDLSSLRHRSSAPRAPGRVVLWPLVPANEAADAGVVGGAIGVGDDAEEDGWIDSATRKVANRIAATVRGWVDHGIDGEAVRPRDVLVLVRSRKELAGLIVSRMQAHGVPVAGVDRLQLKTPIAVQDLLVAARFAVQPLDNLSLASLLVSPLIGWSHADLVEQGWRADGEGRSGPLWPHLNKQAMHDILPGGLSIAPLKDLLNKAGQVTPHRFFEEILSGPMQGRAKLIARLGNAARDPIEELVTKAIEYQTREGASLHGFLSAFDRGEVEIKRELDNDADEVRVMTVHGSKGLQARIVILADAAHDPDASKDRGIDWPTDAGPVPLLPVKKEDRPEILAKAAEALNGFAMQEHWRLLYVAMTRAERMLFVAGALSKKAKEGLPPEKSWYAALQPVVEHLAGDWQPLNGQEWASECAYVVSGSETRAAKLRKIKTAVAIPDWVRASAPMEPRPLRPLAPSAIGESDELEVPRLPVPSRAPGLAAERGVLMHALFERLPPVTAAARRAAGAGWLARNAMLFDADQQAAMLDAVLAVLDDPAHTALFGPGSLAEVPFSALVEGRVIAGAIDRLLVSDDAVRVIDYKTGHIVPDRAETVPPGYLRQMAAYVAALAVIFPDRPVSAALLFTGGPQLIDLSPELLDRHKPSYGDRNAISVNMVRDSA